MSHTASLLEALRELAGDRRRTSIDDVWGVYRTVVRGTTGQADARAELAELLAQLGDQGEVDLPKGRNGWDESVAPPLPRWVTLRRPERERTERPDARSIAWPPELVFANDTRFDRVLDDLLAIKGFLAEGGRKRPMVPLRERSLQIFGDEKRLDGLTKTSLFRDGHLSLDLLRCYEVAPPLVFEAVLNAAAPVVLVIENLHTYESFRKWNRNAREYAAIVYGHGSEFRGTVRDLPRVCEEVTASRVEYFGDLDREGLCIPIQAQRALSATSSDLVVRPAGRWYEMLIEVGRRLRCEQRDLGQDGNAALLWLGEPTGPLVAELLGSGSRLAQEDVGTERLIARGV